MKKSKAILIVISAVVVLVAILYYLVFFVFSDLGTSFAKACGKVESGMTKEQALSIMQEFQNDKDITFLDKNNVLTYTTPGLSGDYQCYISLDDQNKVKLVTKIFD